MRSHNPKTRCIKRKLSKFKNTLKAYDKVQNAYADILEADEAVVTVECNVLFEDKSIGEYTTDFVCEKQDGSIMVRECTTRNVLLRPRTIRLLDLSREYWWKRGITDWKVIINVETK